MAHYWYSKNHYLSLKDNAVKMFGENVAKHYIPRGTCLLSNGKEEYYTLTGDVTEIASSYVDLWKDVRYLGMGHNLKDPDRFSKLYLSSTPLSKDES